MYNVAISLLALFLIGCGGGGGSNVPGECSNYCRTACAKVSNCGFSPQSQSNECTSACIDVIRADGIATSESCQDAATLILISSCNEVAQIFGFRSHNSRVSELDEIEAFMFGEQLGYLNY